jgi:hypothetical protein
MEDENVFRLRYVTFTFLTIVFCIIKLDIFRIVNKTYLL